MLDLEEKYKRLYEKGFYDEIVHEIKDSYPALTVKRIENGQPTEEDSVIVPRLYRAIILFGTSFFTGVNEETSPYAEFLSAQKDPVIEDLFLSEENEREKQYEDLKRNVFGEKYHP